MRTGGVTGWIKLALKKSIMAEQRGEDEARHEYAKVRLMCESARSVCLESQRLGVNSFTMRSGSGGGFLFFQFLLLHGMAGCFTVWLTMGFISITLF